MSPDACCVTDTNVWIDLRVGNLLDNVFELDARWLIPDLVGRELGTERKQLLVEWGLEVRSLTGDEIEAVIRLNETYSAPSRTDMATLVVARAEDGILVTGDGALRNAAEEEGIEVHGTLWVVDALVDTGTVAPGSRSGAATHDGGGPAAARGRGESAYRRMAAVSSTTTEGLTSMECASIRPSMG